MVIRPETEADWPGVDQVVATAFGQGLEVLIVQRMRSLPEYIPSLALLAEDASEIVGQVLLSRMYLEQPGPSVVGLGPISVLPERQRQGVGTALMGAAIAGAREMGFDGIALLGHPTYYPRFGFVPASRFGLRFTYDVPDDVAMALELRPGALDGVGGLLRYSSAFDEEG
jgi:putative acetyltransferase